MGDSRSAYYEKLDDEIAHENAIRREQQSKELRIPIELGQEINELYEYLKTNVDKASYSFGNGIMHRLNSLEKWRIG